MENTLHHTIVVQNGSYQEDTKQEMCLDGKEAVDP